MNIDSLNIFANLCFQSLNSEEWDLELIKYLDWDIEDLKIDFYNELENELYGKNVYEKKDIITILISEINKIKLETLNVCYSNEEKEEYKYCISVQKKLISLYDDLIIIISQNCLLYSIDLKNIIDHNFYAKNKVDISFFIEEIKDIQKEKFDVDNTLKIHFDQISYDFFKYLIKNFNPNFENSNKYSCIYRLMIRDKYLSEDLKPEHFKRLLFQNKIINKEISVSLYQASILTKKVMTEYDSLRKKYFDIT